ncbi:MAG TPA: pitrilysin family protein [Thermoanaerobaculia bacterium]
MSIRRSPAGALYTAAWLAVMLAGIAGITPLRAAEPAAGGVVTLPSPRTPIVAVRLVFDAGSIDDPAGKEGLAALTARMITKAGTEKHSFSQLVETLYPMAASVDGEVDREVTVFSGKVHRDHLAPYTDLLVEAVLEPAFTPGDFERNKEETLAFLTTTLRSGSDELLGLEEIQDRIFAGHSYGHPPAGTVAGLKSITIEDVKAFYKAHYTRARLLVGVAGGYPADYPAALAKDLDALPAGTPGRAALPPAPAVEGRRFTLVDKRTASVGLHFGYPLPITRSDPDFYPLMVVDSYLGEHRTSHGKLMSELREKRGLNYGDYSYIEHRANPPRTSTPVPGVPRREQYFSVWIRPVEPQNARFALRAALYQVAELREHGMTQAQFELTRDFVVNYAKLWGQTLQNRLGFLMDSRFYGTPSFLDEIQARVPKLTLDEVNRAAKKYLQTEDYQAVLVTDHAADLKAALEKDDPSPKTYNAKVDPDVLDTDKKFEDLKIRPTSIEIVPVAEVFEK